MYFSTTGGREVDGREKVEEKGGQAGVHLYLGYEALSDSHRVGVALLKIMKKVPETNTVLKEISI